MYICQNCGFKSHKWFGKCPQCEEWGTFIEETKNFNDKKSKNLEIKTSKSLSNIKTSIIKTNLNFFDETVGGIVKGGIYLVSGQPGIGKTTFLLMLANNLSEKFKTIFASTEETTEQLAIKINRLNLKNEFFITYIKNEENLPILLNEFEIVIIDSLPMLITLSSSNEFQKKIENLITLAKESNSILILVNHITKSGEFAGPKILEHLVDTTIFLENFEDKILFQTLKNRFYKAPLATFLKMQEKNFVIYNHEQINSNPQTGTVFTTLNISNKFLIKKVECLVTNSSNFQLNTFGIDYSLSSLLVNLLSKFNLKLFNKSIFFKVDTDKTIKQHNFLLPMATALLSSYFNIPINIGTTGSISLNGNIIFPPNIKQINKLFKNLNLQTLNQNLKNIKDLIKFLLSIQKTSQ